VSERAAGRPGSVRFAVRLTPRAGADRVEGVSDEGVLIVRVAAPPVDGVANEALVELLAHELDIAPSAIRVVSGANSRRKLVAVSGVRADLPGLRWPNLRV
jgi:uncharacterized protein